MGEGNQIRFWWENTIHMSKGVLRRERCRGECEKCCCSWTSRSHELHTKLCAVTFVYVLSYFLNFINVSFSPFEDWSFSCSNLPSFFYPKYILMQVFLLSFVWKATFSCRWWTVWGWHVGLMLCGQWFQAVSFQAARPLRQGLHLLEGTGNISHTGSAQ